MAKINESVYGARENWIVPSTRTEQGTYISGISYDSTIDEINRIKIANYNTVDNPRTLMRTQMSGDTHSGGYAVNNEWLPTQTSTIDNSIVQFGIGSQSALSNIEWWGKVWANGETQPDMGNHDNVKLINSDHYDVTNIAFAFGNTFRPSLYASSGGMAGNGYMQSANWQYLNEQLWGDSRCFFSSEVDVVPASAYALVSLITQIPIKNTKIYPVIRAYNSQMQSSEYNSIQDYIADKANYPFIYCIYAKFTTKVNSSTWTTIDVSPWFFNLTGIAKGFGNGDIVRNENIMYLRTRDLSGGFFIIGGCPNFNSQSYYQTNGFYWHYNTASVSFDVAELMPIYQPEDLKFEYDTAKNAFICDVSSMTDDQITEGIRKQLASFGMFFVDDIDDINLALDDDKTFLGILENGVGYGKYSNGKKNREQDQWNWDTMEENDYDPSNPPSPIEPGDDPAASDSPLLPVGLEWTLAGTGTGIWALTPSEISQVWDDIFGSDIKLDKFGDNPMNAIVSLQWTPYVWSSEDKTPIILGNEEVNPGHLYPIIRSISNAEIHGYGQMKFNFNKNFYNARNIQARLFLPFYGYYELPAAQLLSSRLRVDFYYDVPDELGVWVISYDNVIYDFVECSTNMEIPITGSNAAAIRQSKINEALTIATQVASLAATTAAAYSGIRGIVAMGDAIGAEVSGLASDVYGPVGENVTGNAAYNAFRGTAIGSMISTGLNVAGKGINIYNTVKQAQVQRAALRTNLPYHGSALQTTFLHMSMTPYVQIFKNTIMGGFETQDGGTVRVELGGTDEAEYKLKVGHACNKFATIAEMDNDCLLQTTGLADNPTTGMELSEVNELNTILQSGFLK